MLAALPAPVLSLHIDAVLDLDGREALVALLTLFSKNNNAISGASRLENIAERLWHRSNTSSFNYRPPTPMSEFSAPQFDAGSLVPHRSSQTYSLSHSTHSCHAHVCNSKSGSPLGRILVDIFTQRFSVPVTLKGALPSPVPEPQSSSLPTPASEPVEAETLLPATTRGLRPPFRSASHQAPPSVCLPSSPPDSEHAACPRLVVVNPTPSLTPHPTPPMTPILQAPGPAFGNPPATHLLPSALPANLTSLAPALSPSVTPRATSAPPQPPPSLTDTQPNRFFLQQTESITSPDQDESLHPPMSPVVSTGRSDTGSSVGSGPSVPAEIPHGVTQRSVRPVRKGKEPSRHMPMRRARPPQIRRATTMDSAKPRATFNIGSTSSTGSKFTETSKSASKGSTSERRVSLGPILAPLTAAVVTLAQPPPPPLAARSPPKPPVAPPVVQPNRRRIVVASTSSEYETTDTEEEEGAGDSWASEDLSTEDVARAKEDSKLRAAALEAQRQREMFAKVPRRSYSAVPRTQSGLLSQLLNPDPARFPPNHPYRTIQSSADLVQLPRTSTNRPPPTLQTSKSSAAVPLAAQVTARSIAARGGISALATAAAVATNGANKSPLSPRRKGQPQGAEMEDDTDSGGENSADKIQVSRSVAHQKLAALAGKHVSPPEHVAAPAPPVKRHQQSDPIPYGHPYNLPPPAAPSTPRTTRRQMLATEMSESLRRNLLWERQVSKTNVVGVRRQSSGTIAPATTTTTTTSIVQVSARTGEQRNEQAQDREEPRMKKSAVARHRSWMDDYHYSGW